MTIEEKDDLLKFTGINMLNLISNLSKIKSLRDSSNEASIVEFPTILPCELVNLPINEFTKIIHRQQRRLLNTFTLSDIDIIEQEFLNLKREFKKNINLFDENTMTFNSWNGLNYPLLKMYCGGLSTVFLGTANVESDFSIVNFEKSDYRTSLSDFSLEGILHCKQYDQLNTYWNNIIKEV